MLKWLELASEAMTLLRQIAADVHAVRVHLDDQGARNGRRPADPTDPTTGTRSASATNRPARWVAPDGTLVGTKHDVF